jgi:UDP-N-acetylglucosamine acyltransferase
MSRFFLGNRLRSHRLCVVIHSTAIIHASARLHSSVQVGPYAVIDQDVTLGADCIVGPHVYLTGRTEIGAGNRFYAGAVIGEAPQDLKYTGEPTGLKIGDKNVFREHVTVHRSTRPDAVTVIGSNCYLMASAHIGHNSLVGNHVIIANGTLLGGHVTIDDRAFISGTCLLHQGVRVGTLALMQGGAAISKDLPPFTIARGGNAICGLNTIGLRRAGLSPSERLQLRQAYLSLFRSPLPWREALAKAQTHFTNGHAKVLFEFILASRRGVCHEARGRQAELEE